jgi:hypothetical protein
MEGFALRKIADGDWLPCAGVEMQETRTKIMVGKLNLNLRIACVNWFQQITAEPLTQTLFCLPVKTVQRILSRIQEKTRAPGYLRSVAIPHIFFSARPRHSLRCRTNVEYVELERFYLSLITAPPGGDEHMLSFNFCRKGVSIV